MPTLPLDPIALELAREAGDAVEVQVVKGPRGGNLEGSHAVEARRSSFKGERTEAGLLTLHHFHDVTVPGLKNEQPWHRMAALLMLNGTDNGTIARAAGVKVGEVVILRSQKWFQELLVNLADDQACGLTGLLRSELPNAIENIIAIANDPEVPARTRLAANQDLVDRAEGKAIQRSVSSSNVSHNLSPSDEMQEIQRELAMLRGGSIPVVSETETPTQT